MQWETAAQNPSPIDLPLCVGHVAAVRLETVSSLSAYAELGSASFVAALPVPVSAAAVL